MFLLGLDIGSSSVKAAIVDGQTHAVKSIASFPSTEMDIFAAQASWAEQDPELWWRYTKMAIQEALQKASISSQDIKSIGISYQMHGLVCLDKKGVPVRQSIIWCDSRAVEIGNQATKDLGDTYCNEHFLNAPGNFTASKLKWVKNNEPEIYDRIHKIMLPGDYIAYKLTGEISTTVSGLSEGILWDFTTKDIAQSLLDYYKIDRDLLADIKDTFSIQGTLQTAAANDLNLAEGIPIAYRAGDQPNNAMSLGVVSPGQVAGTGGTSGVVYAVSDKLIHDPKMRVNSFAHVNYKSQDPRIGILLCINGCGIQYGWLRKLFGDQDIDYKDIEQKSAKIDVGCNGLSIIPFGNGAERMFQNQNIGAHIKGLEFNTHSKAHLYRAGLEGIAYAFYYGIECMKSMGVEIHSFRVGNDNLFQSEIFSKSLANLAQAEIKVVDTTGAVGAAIGSGIGTGLYHSPKEAFVEQEIVKIYEPEPVGDALSEAYQRWNKHIKNHLEKTINT